MAPAATLQSLIRDWTRHGDRPAVTVLREPDPEVWSYDHLARSVQRLATGLLLDGLQRGEPVVLLGTPSPAWLACFFAVIAAGGIAVPLDVQLPEEELGKLLRDSRCHRLFATRRHLERLRGSEKVAGLLPFLLDAEGESDAPAWTTLVAPNADPLPALEPDAPAVLLYTSGTTGAPKGVPLTHANLMSNLGALRRKRWSAARTACCCPCPCTTPIP